MDIVFFYKPLTLSFPLCSLSSYSGTDTPPITLSTEEPPALYGSVILDVVSGTARWSPEPQTTTNASNAAAGILAVGRRLPHAEFTVLPLGATAADCQRNSFPPCKLMLFVNSLD